MAEQRPADVVGDLRQSQCVTAFQTTNGCFDADCGTLRRASTSFRGSGRTVAWSKRHRRTPDLDRWFRSAHNSRPDHLAPVLRRETFDASLSITTLTDNNNPYRPPQQVNTVAFEQVLTTPELWLRRTTLMLCVLIVVAVAIAFINVFSIVFSGTAAVFLGLIITILGIRSGRVSGILFGGSALAITVAVFIWINVMDWSPEDAQEPVPLVLAAYAFFFTPVGIMYVLSTWSGGEKQTESDGNEDTLKSPQ